MQGPTFKSGIDLIRLDVTVVEQGRLAGCRPQLRGLRGQASAASSGRWSPRVSCRCSRGPSTSSPGTSLASTRDYTGQRRRRGGPLVRVGRRSRKPALGRRAAVDDGGRQAARPPGNERSRRAGRRAAAGTACGVHRRHPGRRARPGPDHGPATVARAHRARELRRGHRPSSSATRSSWTRCSTASAIRAPSTRPAWSSWRRKPGTCCTRRASARPRRFTHLSGPVRFADRHRRAEDRDFLLGRHRLRAPDAAPVSRKSAKRAIEARLTLYVVQVDSFAFDTSERASSAAFMGDQDAGMKGLGTLTGMTGGVLFRGVAEGKGIWERIERESGGLYVLGVEPEARSLPTEPLALSVKVKRPGLTVRTPQQVVPPRPLTTWPDPKRALGYTLRQPRMAVGTAYQGGGLHGARQRRSAPEDRDRRRTGPAGRTGNGSGRGASRSSTRGASSPMPSTTACPTARRPPLTA